jgi:hypothetical protein
MNRRVRSYRSAGAAIVVLAAAAGATLLSASPAATGAPATSRAPSAAAPGRVYDFRFAGSTGTVPNSAPGGPIAILSLVGDWSLSTNGVHFAGNTTGKSSVAHGKPITGDTLNVPAGEAVGARARIKYVAPTNGKCFGDTPNITQIGRFAAGAAQAKLQLSKCSDSATHVVVQCRFAGSLTPIKVDPVSSTLHLTSGDSYLVTCMKSPDRANATAVVTLAVTEIGATTSSRTVTSTFTVAALGPLTTKQVVSAGNKYPLPASANNTDQFNGNIVRVMYCVGTSSVVRSCLAS